MLSSQWVRRVYVMVAVDTESRSVGFAGYMGWGLLADLANPDPRVAGCELVGRVDIGIAVDA